VCAKFNASYSKETLERLRAQSLARMGKIDHYVYYCVDFDVTKLEAGIADGVSVYSVEEAEAIAENFKFGAGSGFHSGRAHGHGNNQVASEG